ncbi:hypothetical protein FRC08_002989 [Ceratobasidium sp. 394]|nr:hypothetical protein FRC08_002989 [Ceratobasidium sp. 394]
MLMPSNIRISWSPSNTYSEQPDSKVHYEVVVAFSAITAHFVRKRGAVEATIVGGLHASPMDERSHLTVDYYRADGTKISRRHIVPEGKLVIAIPKLAHQHSQHVSNYCQLAEMY